MFIDKLQSIFSRLKTEKPHALILTGDFNCRSSQWWHGDTEQPEGSDLDELIETNNLYQLIDEPTNIRGDSMSCIDLIITDQPAFFVETGVNPSLDDFCQHQIVHGKVNIAIPFPPPYKRTVWDYSKADILNIRSVLRNIDWHLCFHDMGSNEMVEKFYEVLKSTFSEKIPNKIVQFNDKDPPWISHEVKNAIKRKHRVYKKFVQRGRRVEDWENVKEVRKSTSKLIANAKENYYQKLGRKLSDPNTGTKAFWSSLKRLTGNKKHPSIPPILENGLFVVNFESKANVLNDYFVAQCCSAGTSSTIPNFVPNSVPALQHLDINRERVLKLIQALDSSKSHGCDDISVTMIKICEDAIVEPLCMIFERCIETGIYPSSWKKANVVPIHKKGSRQCKNNYRPISLLPFFSKIFEKLLFDAIYSHLSENKLLTPNQSGFRPGDSTINQLLFITHKIYCAFDHTPSKETRAVFLDLSKAFDRVWHEGLIHKLRCNGVSGDMLALICNFLMNRKQRVVLNGKNSEWKDILAGVPQGSVLGPLFFLIYINDLCDNLNSDVRLFADDTSLFSVIENEIIGAEELNRDLEKVRLWAWQWKMQFNTDKTEEVIFSTKLARSFHPPLLLGNDEVKREDEHKHLGMILDSKLNFKSHIRAAILKARRGIGLIRYLSKYVSRDVLNLTYKLYVRPHLDYGDLLYHRYDPEMRLGFTQKLEQTQYAAALAVSGAWRGTNRQRLYNELGWETLYSRRWYRRLCHFFYLKNNQSPEYLFNLIPAERQTNYDLRNQRIYTPAVSRTVRFSNTYFSNAPYEWNLLDRDIRSSESIAEFKRKLLSKIRPAENSIYNIYDIEGVRILTKLRLNFSALNEHRFRHRFNIVSPLCNCSTANEDTEHFLLHCPMFYHLRRNLLGQLSKILSMDVSNFDDDFVCSLMLYGNSELPYIVNRMILEATLEYIKSSRRFVSLDYEN